MNVMTPWIKLLLEAGPLAVFFFANARFGLMTATAAFMVATALSLAATYLLERKIAVLPLVSGLFVLAFGGLTLWLDDDLFIKMKPTIVNTLFATIVMQVGCGPHTCKRVCVCVCVCVCVFMCVCVCVCVRERE